MIILVHEVKYSIYSYFIIISDQIIKHVRHYFMSQSCRYAVCQTVQNFSNFFGIKRILLF
jgi:hypothetical protein